ncbi:MAG: YbhB/YbcL family Raf kinase inhibitor-like protein [Rickettsiales bacterium]|jgi:Raf kinase inhibitor-like YbhB/YbcL family protein|nr:YbhB/YbcL family Raf kinase inhibitor-like protein [Rickettsiales bacterium]
MRFFLIFCFFLTSIEAMEVDKAFLKRDYEETGKFTLFSSDFYEQKENISKEQFYNGWLCEDKKEEHKNMSPTLYWKFPPEGANYFALVMKDNTTNWYHWGVYNIPLEVNRLKLGINNEMFGLPFGIKETVNDFGTKSYAGPCLTDDKRHTYTITIYAFKEKIPNTETTKMLEFIANRDKISSTSIKAFYGKNIKQVNKATPKTAKAPAANVKEKTTVGTNVRKSVDTIRSKILEKLK